MKTTINGAEYEIGPRADLRDADLLGANLRGADLLRANLWNADLRDANLRSANLRGADLRSADLKSADLKNANLRNADLENANLYNAKNVEMARTPLYSKWPITFHGDKIKIGCEEKTIEEWDKWFASGKEFETKRGTEDFKRIEAHYKAYRAYKIHMDGPE